MAFAPPFRVGIFLNKSARSGLYFEEKSKQETTLYPMLLIRPPLLNLKKLDNLVLALAGSTVLLLAFLCGL